MKNEVMDKVDQYIQQMADSLGVAVEHVYSLLVRQQIVDGVSTIVMFVVAIALLTPLTIWAFKKGEFDEFDIDAYSIVALISGIVLVIMILVGFFEINESIKQLINPEYYALKEILDTVKGGD